MDHARELVPTVADSRPPATTTAVRGELMPRPEPLQGGGLKEAFDFTLRTPALLFVLLLSFGPLALPLIVISPKLGVLTKVLTTVVTLGLTIVLPIALTIYFSHFAVLPALDAIRDANMRGGAI
ncbi:hypothetical protein [Blastopirellula marina]|uniref:Uncharacterized protein n=1 Tax=Blastopirellula marina TaxID=124 RepID=A0A2S8FFC0_9BACT|nr:hypothetical protein [Blastopirellula marina]PQO30842.1 hypothetical protein C5Y98_20845 [Blastopirellula marina]PTL42695.1 hypothetical protein C5Y97_20855 [Blastopirellula marina]